MKLVVIIVFLLGYISSAFGGVGKITFASGKVEIVKKGTFKGVDYKKLDGNVTVGDVVRTKRKSEASVEFVDKTEIFLKERTRLIIEKYLPGGDVYMNLPYGKVIYRVIGRTTGTFKVRTSVALIGVKGTSFFIKTNFHKIVVGVVDGVVEIESLLTGKKLLVRRGTVVIIDGSKKFQIKTIEPKQLQQIMEENDTEKISTETDMLDDILNIETVKDEVAQDIGQNEIKEKEKGLDINVNIPETSIEGM